MGLIKLTEEEEQILDYITQFSQKEVKPLAREIDEKKTVPEKLIMKMREMGLFSTYIPKEYGGAGLSFSFLVRAIEEISKACPSTALVLDGALTLFADPLIMFGNENIKKKYLTRVAKGAIGGLALTEAEAGSDAASIRTRAEKRGDKYVLNGTKIFISNGRIAEFFVVDAVTDPGKGNRGISTFVVDSSMKGFRINRDIQKMGIRGSSTVELEFNNVEVPEENMVGELNRGFKVVMDTLDSGRIGIAAQALGIAQSALDEAIEYIKGRKQFGKSISEFQGIQFMIADLSTEIEAARMLTYKAAEMWDGKENTIKISSMAKLFASDVAMKVTTESLQLFGGYGYTTELSAERHMRDAKITQIYEGTNQIQRMIIARELLK
ncbi:MAG: acyl-CoA dehydrogenase [Thermoplasmataceae archaeon]|jgi:alkylation response protein AidB-like acyl-CoA dehydrogenase|nr:acyl-CoA dehydrogenase [Candidatus Thermoplasmatota archaeon]